MFNPSVSTALADIFLGGREKAGPALTEAARRQESGGRRPLGWGAQGPPASLCPAQD